VRLKPLLDSGFRYFKLKGENPYGIRHSSFFYEIEPGTTIHSEMTLNQQK
jgi:hypothetical protein